MTIQRMIELLEIEHECMLRGSHDDCDRNCADCELVQDDSDLHEMYTNVIALMKEQEPILLENQHKPYGINTNANSPWISRCPRCGKKVEGKQTRFCKYCGQAVKWNDK